MTNTQQPSEPYKVDRDNLPPELRAVTADQLEGAITNTEKAKNMSIERQRRQQEEHDRLVREGKALNLIESSKRCYGDGDEQGNHGTEELGVKKSG